MKILFVTDLFPVGNEKIARALYYFVQEWKKQGHEIDVIRSNFVVNTLLRGRKIVEEKMYEENGIKIFNLNFHTPFLFNVYKKLPDGFSLKNYDVIISHMPCGALMAQKLLKRDRIKYICAVHASDIRVLTDVKYSFYFKNQLKKAFLLSDRISARSPVLKEKINKIIPETEGKTFICPSGIPDKYINNSENKQINKDRLSIITACSLIKRKNVNTVIKAVKLFEKFSLKIAGSGREESSLKEISSSNVTFLGHLNRDEVFNEMKKSDIFVLLSDEETFGLAYLEAMAAGCIVIGKNNDGIAGIIIDGVNGFLINNSVEDLKKCLEKITKLSDTQIEEIKANSRKTILEYTEYKTAEKYIENIK